MEWSSQRIALIIGQICIGYTAILMTVAAALAVLQEYKIWKPKMLPTLSPWGMIKVFLFNLAWFVMCLVGSIIISVKWVLSLGTSDIEYEGSQWVEYWAAVAVFALFVGPVRVEGVENLPKKNTVPAPVFIANHESQLDVGAVYFIQRRFKWIAKHSVLYLPGVGTIMWLSGHVLIKRKGNNRKSVSNLYEKSKDAVQSGIPMFIFPQGTRWIAERRDFKDGAFKIAAESKSPLVPISITIPRNAWNSSYPLSLLWGKQPEPVRLTIHPAIRAGDKEDRESLKTRCMDKIYSVLEPVQSKTD